MQKGLNPDWKTKNTIEAENVLPLPPVKGSESKEYRMAEVVAGIVRMVGPFDLVDRAAIFDCVERLFRKEDSESTAAIGRELQKNGKWSGIWKS